MTQLSPAVSGFGRREFGGSGFVVLAPGAGILLVAIAVRGLGLADDAAPPHPTRIPAWRPCLGTNAPPWTITNAGPDVAPILCYDR
jgi:hypothetical protein